MSTIHAYAAKAPKGPLQPFEFELGELRPDEVEIKVTHCGICHSDISMLDNEWGHVTISIRSRTRSSWNRASSRGKCPGSESWPTGRHRMDGV